MVEASNEPRLIELRSRIDELDRRSAYLLIFISFVISGTVLFWSTDLITSLQENFLLDAMRWFALAILPLVIAILPMKEFRENGRRWYGYVRFFKSALLWLAIICIVIGTTYLFRALLVAEPSDNSESTRAALGFARRQ